MRCVRSENNNATSYATCKTDKASVVPNHTVFVNNIPRIDIFLTAKFRLLSVHFGLAQGADVAGVTGGGARLADDREKISLFVVHTESHTESWIYEAHSARFRMNRAVTEVAPVFGLPVLREILLGGCWLRCRLRSCYHLLLLLHLLLLDDLVLGALLPGSLRLEFADRRRSQNVALVLSPSSSSHQLLSDAL
jgi:hypothetical protein